MKLVQVFLVCGCFVLFSLVLGVAEVPFGISDGLAARAAGGLQGDKLVYADFETVKDNRPVSNGGGAIQLVGYQQNPTMQSRFKGQDGSNPPAPELVHLKKDDPNRAIAFSYQILSPNDWAGVGVEIHAREQKDGKEQAIDVGSYKYLTLQLYASGAQYGRVDFVSRDQGMNLNKDFPQAPFSITQGFNTYRIPLNSVSQPSYVDVRISEKELLKKLTAIQIYIYCQQCAPMTGQVVIDNVVFTK
ncbi:MAG TPA: hypothetical protein VI756_06510 [Blastocatellia bacterium]